MLKAGVPAQAVRLKMGTDGLSARVVSVVCGVDANAAAVDKSAKPAGLSAEEEDAVGKFRAMLKAGVPVAAVRLKMAGAGLQGHLIAALCGAEDGADDGKGAWSGRSKAEAKAKEKKAVGSKLLTLHWTPLGISQVSHPK